MWQSFTNPTNTLLSINKTLRWKLRKRTTVVVEAASCKYKGDGDGFRVMGRN